MFELAVILISLVGAYQIFGRGCGLSGRKPSWAISPIFGETEQPDGTWAWQITKPFKTMFCGVCGALMAACSPMPEVLGSDWWVLLVGLAFTGTFAMGHTVNPFRKEHALVLNLMDMAPGFLQGIWLGAASGVIFTLPMAVWHAMSGNWQSVALDLIGGALKPVCYWMGGRICDGRNRCNPDNPSSALHGATSWGCVAAATLLAV